MKRFQCLLSLVLLFLIILLACGGNNSVDSHTDIESGALKFSVAYHGSDSNLHPKEVNIDCAGLGIDQMEASVYDSTGSLIADGGPWNCDIGEGTITSAPAGSNRTIAIFGKDVNENLIFRGQKDGIDVVTGGPNDAGIIDCYDFVPSLMVPADEAQVNYGAIGFAWSIVQGASQYHLVVSQNSTLTDPVINETVTSDSYTNDQLSSSTTYFWQIIAEDAQYNTGLGSRIYSFSVNEAPPNTAPTAQIQCPIDGIIYVAGDAMVFTGSGSDTEDGVLSGSSLVWKSNLNQQIGTGESLNLASLIAGTHMITLTATDADWAQGSDSVTIVVNDGPATGGLPDTGQTTSYTSAFGEDSDYTINPPAYTKLDASGNILHACAPDWRMVRDDVTGLIWEVKTDDGSIHDKNNTYTWQAAQDDFIVQLNNDKFGGHSNWRLPSRKELSTLVHSDNFKPAINTAYFSLTMSSYYWSSTTNTFFNEVAWALDFSSGNIHRYLKEGDVHVRAVCDGQ